MEQKVRNGKQKVPNGKQNRACVQDHGVTRSGTIDGDLPRGMVATRS